MKKITTFAELVNLLTTAQIGGHKVSVTTETKWDLRKNPTDGCVEIGKLPIEFQPTKLARYTMNFAEDYANSKAKAQGIDPDDVVIDNALGWVHDIPNVLKHRESTPHLHNLIVMYKTRVSLGYRLNGMEMSAEQIAFAKHYIPKPSKNGNLPKYLAPYISNIREIVMEHETYAVSICE